ncbi:DUF6286 domain-containing protein [Streptomyces sp. NPDC021093]|uniref:DUF6286 domain-containing protein n=1 Tax=Streptomyces sp. NPDC021093 TaxID=3365112 RepID=UPI0037A21B9F
MTAPPHRQDGPRAAAVAPAERGTTTIADRAVRRIAARSALEALHGDGPAARTAHPTGAATAAPTTAPTTAPSALPSATVSRTGRTATVALRLSVPYEADLADTGERLQQHVARRTAELTGLTVPPPEVRVTSLSGIQRRGRVTVTRPQAVDVPQVPPAAEYLGAPEPAPPKARRPWSPRRLPVFLVAFVGAAGAAYLLGEAVARRTGHSVLPAAPRPDVLHRIATTSLADPASLVAGAVVLGCGLWLLGAAVLPGLRNRVPMTVRTDGTSAVLDRSAVALLLRDEALAVPGVTSVRVRAGRRRATVRARAAYGELPSVEAELTAAVSGALDSLGLARPLRPRVRLRATSDHTDGATGEGPKEVAQGATQGATREADA